MGAHPPFRSLLEHKAYLRPWLPTVCSHVDFRHDVFLLGDALRDSWLFFEFVPAAQEVETRALHCFMTTMAGSNRWSRSSGSTAQASHFNIFCVTFWNMHKIVSSANPNIALKLGRCMKFTCAKIFLSLFLHVQID